MPNFNSITMIGNLTRDPETITTAGGSSITKFGLATNRKYKTKDGTVKEEATFIDVDAFGKTGEIIAKYSKKGKPLMIQGRLKLDQWEAEDGSKRSKHSIILEQFQFLGTADTAEDANSSLDSEPPF